MIFKFGDHRWIPGRPDLKVETKDITPALIKTQELIDLGIFPKDLQGSVDLLVEYYKRRNTMNDDQIRNDQMVEAHAVDQQEQTTAEQAAAAGLDVPEFLRRKEEEERQASTAVEPLPLP